jgi:hypothetical protein
MKVKGGRLRARFTPIVVGGACLFSCAVSSTPVSDLHDASRPPQTGDERDAAAASSGVIATALPQSDSVCPPDTSVPPPARDCPSERVSGANKVDDEVWQQLDESAGPVQVILTINGGPKVCPLPECPDRTCPAREAELAYFDEQIIQSQRCVHALLETLGVTGYEVLSLANAVSATLTRAQVEAVAEHPHVDSVNAVFDDDVPPP